MIAVLATVMLVLILAVTALAVDTMVVAVAREQLGVAADAAALAGVPQLATDRRIQGVTDLSPEIQAANASASKFVRSNPVLSEIPAIYQNLANAAGGDIVVGYLDPTNPGALLVSDASAAANFNSVQVTTSRASDHGGLVPAYFSRILGFSGTTVRVQSTATAQLYSIRGYTGTTTLNAAFLPIVLDLSTYQTMMKGQTQDQYTYNSANKSVSAGPDGVTESLLYPAGSGNPGNWGTIQVGVTSNSTSVIGAQISDGITPQQMATYPDSTIALDPTLTPPSITFRGNPGLSAGIKDNLASIIGKPVVIPIYDQSSAQGANTWFRVVDFATVRIMAVEFSGNPKYVIVQPAIVQDSTAIAGTPATSWTSGGLLRIFLSR
jgi:hypothetical protein